MADPKVYTFRSDVNVRGGVYSTEQGRLIGDSAPSAPKVGDVALIGGVLKRCTGTDDAGNPIWEDCDPRVGSFEGELETASGQIADNQNRITATENRITATESDIKTLKTDVAGKQAQLSDEQLKATKSGITADKVKQYDGYAAGKQDALSTAQKAAVDSGITSSLVSTYTGYGSKITELTNAVNGKQDTLKAGEGISISGNTISCTVEAGSKIEVDSTLDASSTNPVQNKTVTAELNGKASTAVASTSKNGLMSKDDKANLDTVVKDIANKLGKDDAAASAKKLTSDGGSSNTPVYFQGGVPVACDLGLGTAASRDVAASIEEGTDKLVTAAQVKTAIATGTSSLKGVYMIKGSTATVPTNPEVGGVWNVSEPFDLPILNGETITVPKGANILYTDEGWDKLSETVDLSGLVSAGAIPAGAGKVLVGTAKQDKAALSETVGSASTPIYLNNGVPTACGTVARATKADEADSAAKATTATSASSATMATQDAAGNVITSTYATKTELNAKAATTYVDTKVSECQKKCLIVSNASFTWVADASNTAYGYKGTYSNSSVSSSDIATVSFSQDDAVSGRYSPVCETFEGGVYIWAKSQPSSLTVPSILIVKG